MIDANTTVTNAAPDVLKALAEPSGTRRVARCGDERLWRGVLTLTRRVTLL
jgi:hypothetical protein